MTDCFIQSSASKRAKSLQTHQSRLLILYLNITSSSSFPPYFLKSVHYIPSPFSSAKSLFYCADAKRNAKQSCIPTVGLCHQSREKFTRIIYCQLCSALLTVILTGILLYRREQRCKAPAHSKYVLGWWGGNKMGILAYNKYYGL